jgi:uncharacterized protein YhfF
LLQPVREDIRAVGATSADGSRRDGAPTDNPYASAVTFSFGDSPELADELLALVIAGTKTASCGALRDYQAGGEPMPVVGRRDVVLDGKGRRAAVIETVEVTIRRFDAVGADLAHDEGEGDRSLAYWREAHEAYFRRGGGFSPDMELVCERFRLIEVFAGARDREGRHG